MSPFVEFPAVFLLRALQAAVLCLPTLFAGMFIAGALTTVIGQDRVRRWMSRGNYRDWLYAVLFALALPVCSIGVLPVAAILRAMRVRWGSVVIIVLVAPVVTPYTLGYLIDRTGWEALAWLIGSTIIGAIATAWAVERVLPASENEPPEADSSPSDASLILAFIRSSGASLTPGTIAIAIVAFVGVGLLAIAIPPNAVGEWLVERNALHATLLSIVPWLTYVTPSMNAMQAGEIVQSSTMPGLLIPLISIGAAMHLGVMVVAFRQLGIRAAAIGMLTFALIATPLGFAADCRLHDPAFKTDDSHAFEDYGRPFHLLDHPDGALAGFVNRFKRPLSGGELLAGVGLTALWGVKRIGRFSSPMPLPGSHVAGTRFLRLAAASTILGTGLLTLYTSVPSPKMILDESRRLSAELSSAMREQQPVAIERIRRLLDMRLSQLPVSSLLRLSPFNPEQDAAIQQARRELSAMFTDSELTSLPVNKRDQRFLLALRHALRLADRKPKDEK